MRTATVTHTHTAESIRDAVLTVRDLTLDLRAMGPQTPRSADLSGMPRGGGGIDRPIPGGRAVTLLGPYSEPTDDHPYEPDDSPVVAQTIIGWARTVAGLRYRPEPRRLADAFAILCAESGFIAAQESLAESFVRELESVTAALRSVVLTEVDEGHDSRPVPLHLPALAGAVPDDAMLAPCDAERFGIEGVAQWVYRRKSRRAGYGPLGEPDSSGRFEMRGYRAWREYIEQKRAGAIA